MRRAIAWLRDHVAPRMEASATKPPKRGLAARLDPELPEIAAPFNARAIARAVAEDLRGLSGSGCFSSMRCMVYVCCAGRTSICLTSSCER